MDSGVHPSSLWHLPCVKELLAKEKVGLHGSAVPAQFRHEGGQAHEVHHQLEVVKGEAKFDVLGLYLGPLEKLSDVQLTSAKEKWGWVATKALRADPSGGAGSNAGASAENVFRKGWWRLEVWTCQSMAKKMKDR